MNNIRVTWQLGLVICCLFSFSVAVFVVGAVFTQPAQRGAGTVLLVCTGIIIVTVLLSALAVRSRLSGVVEPRERSVILKQIRLGLITMALGAGITAISFLLADKLFGSSSKLYLVPTGIYVVGLVAIANAMVPDDTN